MRTRFLQRLTLCVLFLVAGACASNRALNEWQDQTYTGQLDNFLVIAAIDDQTRRRQAEDAYVSGFGELSISATPGYSLLDEAAITRANVEAAIAGSDVDAVLVTRLLGVEEVEQYDPPIGLTHYRSYARYHARALDTMSTGYYRKYTVLTLETSLYDRASGTMVWSMQSESIDAPASQQLIDEQIALTLKRLAAARLIASAQ